MTGDERSNASFPRRALLLCALASLLLSSACAGSFSAQQRSFIDGLNANIGVITVDDAIAAMGPPQETLETPGGVWYTWRKENDAAVSVGAAPTRFFGMSVGVPVDAGRELHCFFDRKTGRLADWNYREW